MKALKLSAIALALASASVANAASPVEQAEQAFYAAQEGIANVATSGMNAFVGFAKTAPTVGATSVGVDVTGATFKNDVIKGGKHYNAQFMGDYAVNDAFKVGAYVSADKVSYKYTLVNHDTGIKVDGKDNWTAWGVGARGSFYVGDFFTGLDVNYKRIEEVNTFGLTGLVGYNLNMGDFTLTPSLGANYTFLSGEGETGLYQVFGRVDAGYKITDSTKLTAGLDLAGIKFNAAAIADKDEGPLSSKFGVRYGARVGVEQAIGKDLAIKFNLGYQQTTVSKLKGFNANLGLTYSF